ncbi:hypothetical protein PRUPE_7G144000 [Prunus persica]|uniref:TF-B3 domain-containing protein n=1 Tax=Prunus persica TaxID=3760 RepID=A0A251NBF4_PRUPE|nr:hypothetical protein PRUPE_7G144000 [Prunus persica]
MARKSSAVRRKPSFFKALVGNFSNQLQIPPAFLVHFDGGKVPQKSHLRTSAGTWPVNVKKADDKFFFQKGWKKFVHDNDLKLCEFLVFGCAGDLGFYVDIYGRNGGKREFVTAERDRPHEEGHGNVFHRKSPRHHGKQNLPSIDPIKYEATDTESETSMHPLATTSTGKTIALQRDNSFNSEKPFFKVALWNSYMDRGVMCLPKNFVKTHLTRHRANVTLRVSDGRTWPVNLIFEGERGKLGGGFMAFCRDNNLKVGDMCVFVLINKIEFLFEAGFYRKTEAANCTVPPEHYVMDITGCSDICFYKLKEQIATLQVRDIPGM